MECAWQPYLNLLPIWMRQSVDKLGRDTLLELRLRLDYPPELVMKSESIWLEKPCNIEDLHFCVNMATKYSPWSAKTTSKGYITAQGGHRIGLCGDAVVADGKMRGLNEPSSLCLRVARDFPGIAKECAGYSGSILIIGRPGSGKTTLLRDLIREKSNSEQGNISVIDERGEVFPSFQNYICFSPGRHTDILTGCRKVQGIEMLLRSMTPDYIAVDEITAKEDCDALLHAGWCGVKLIATAHAGSRSDLFSRPIYQPLINSHIFDTLLILHTDKSWHMERMNL